MRGVRQGVRVVPTKPLVSREAATRKGAAPAPIGGAVPPTSHGTRLTLQALDARLRTIEEARYVAFLGPAIQKLEAYRKLCVESIDRVAAPKMTLWGRLRWLLTGR